MSYNLLRGEVEYSACQNYFFRLGEWPSGEQMGSFPVKFCCIPPERADLGYEAPVSALLLAFPDHQREGVRAVPG